MEDVRPFASAVTGKLIVCVENEQGVPPMEDPADTIERPEVVFAERTTSELVNLIKKLRWVGMEQEAARIQSLLRRADAAATLLSGPWDTD